MFVCVHVCMCVCMHAYVYVHMKNTKVLIDKDPHTAIQPCTHASAHAQFQTTTCFHQRGLNLHLYTHIQEHTLTHPIFSLISTYNHTHTNTHTCAFHHHHHTITHTQTHIHTVNSSSLRTIYLSSSPKTRTRTVPRPLCSKTTPIWDADSSKASSSGEHAS
jgi:hypothetical protein